MDLLWVKNRVWSSIDIIITLQCAELFRRVVTFFRSPVVRQSEKKTVFEKFLFFEKCDMVKIDECCNQNTLAESFRRGKKFSPPS